jgi:hypothetical protein
MRESPGFFFSGRFIKVEKVVITPWCPDKKSGTEGIGKGRSHKLPAFGIHASVFIKNNRIDRSSYHGIRSLTGFKDNTSSM